MKKLILLFLVLFSLILVGCEQPTPEPKQYEIKFIGLDGVVLDTQTLLEGAEVIYPEDPLIDGHDFLGWDIYITIATQDQEIIALYDAHTFTVKFYDYNRKLLDEQVVEYGKDAVAPTHPIVDNIEILGWSKDFTNVKENLKIYTEWQKEYCEVKFLDINGNIIESQKIRNGEAATAPTPPEVRFHVFKQWDNDFSKVTDDLEVQAIYEMEGGYDMENVNYWLQVLSRKYDIEEELLTKEEIAKYNEKILSDYNATRTVDVPELQSTVTKLYVEGLINRYTKINNYPMYNNETKKALNGSEKNAIIDNRNMFNIPSTVNVKYGISVDFAWMRAYPTNHYSNNWSMDRIQETVVNVGEGVAIYHESKDGNWYFVQSYNYNGWVEKKYIAECSQDELRAFLKPEEKIVVISDYVMLENVPVRMGQALPLVSETETTYNVKFPIRNDDGSLFLKEITINKDENYNKGYLKYTYENVFKQAFKLLGIRYSWGDKELDGRDCSSTTQSIYNSFGFMMPRNTTQQMYTPGYGEAVNGVNDKYMQNNYKPGTLIYTSSHVMMYLGENAEGKSWLLHNTNANDAGCILQALESYGGHKMIYTLRLQ